MDIENDAEVLGQILGSIPELVILVDPDGMIRYINRVELGYDWHEVVGAPVSGFIFPDAQRMFQSRLDRVLATGESIEFDVPATAADGSMAWYRCRILPYPDGDEVPSAVILATNITELKAAQQAASRLRRLLPICSWCDRIHTEDGSWKTIEAYLGERMETSVTHGLCPDCYEREMEGAERRRQDKNDAG